MKKPKAPGLASEIEKEVGEAVKAGREQVSLGKAFSELLRQIFGGVKPLSPEEKERLEKEEEREKRIARARVLQEFMPSPQEEHIYYQKQKEEVAKKLEERKKAQEKTWEQTAALPAGRKKRGSLFEFLRRKVTKTERKIGGKF